jgi:CRP-like cAMP-binding protein
LTRRPRTADVVAATDVDIMVLDKEIFEREILYNPSRMPQVLELLAQRLADTLDLLAC